VGLTSWILTSNQSREPAGLLNRFNEKWGRKQKRGWEGMEIQSAKGLRSIGGCTASGENWRVFEVVTEKEKKRGRGVQKKEGAGWLKGRNRRKFYIGEDPEPRQNTQNVRTNSWGGERRKRMWGDHCGIQKKKTIMWA